MWKVEFFILMILGVSIYLAFAWVNFADFVGILLKIFPLKPPTDYKVTLYVRNDTRFKQHKNKWTKYYVTLTLVYIVSYIVITIVTKSYGLSFILSLAFSLFVFGIASNSEIKQRHNIEAQIKKELNTNKKLI